MLTPKEEFVGRLRDPVTTALLRDLDTVVDELTSMGYLVEYVSIRDGYEVLITWPVSQRIHKIPEGMFLIVMKTLQGPHRMIAWSKDGPWWENTKSLGFTIRYNDN